MSWELREAAAAATAAVAAVAAVAPGSWGVAAGGAMAASWADIRACMSAPAARWRGRCTDTGCWPDMVAGHMLAACAIMGGGGTGRVISCGQIV